MLTRDQVERALPANLRSNATQSFTDQINNLTTDPIAAEHIRENFISYTKVLKDGKYKAQDYLNAVAYVTYKHMGYSNQEAYFRTFPQRHAALLAKNTSSKDISAYVAAYHRGQLVNAILEQSLIPMWLVNQDTFQKAINTQVEIMEDSNLPAVARTAAANSILTHLAKPKESAAALQINVGESTGMRELMGMLTDLAQRQREAIEQGLSTKEIAAQKIIDVESEVVATESPVKAPV